jgi:hypothetical protein
MDQIPVPAVLAVIAAAVAAATLIHRYAPSMGAFMFRRHLATVAVKRAFMTCLHVFDRKARCFDRYARAMSDFETAIELRNGIEKRISDALGAEGRAAVRDMEEFAMLERHLERCRDRAAAYLGSMPDEDIAVVSRNFQEGILEGVVPLSAVMAFYRDERELVRAAPHMVSGHFERMEFRFNKLYNESLIGGPLP